MLHTVSVCHWSQVNTNRISSGRSDFQFKAGLRFVSASVASETRHLTSERDPPALTIPALPLSPPTRQPAAVPDATTRSPTANKSTWSCHSVPWAASWRSTRHHQRAATQEPRRPARARPGICRVLGQSLPAPAALVRAAGTLVDTRPCVTHAGNALCQGPRLQSGGRHPRRRGPRADGEARYSTGTRTGGTFVSDVAPGGTGTRGPRLGRRERTICRAPCPPGWPARGEGTASFHRSPTDDRIRTLGLATHDHKQRPAANAERRCFTRRRKLSLRRCVSTGRGPEPRRRETNDDAARPATARSS